MLRRLPANQQFVDKPGVRVYFHFESNDGPISPAAERKT
jgi:hypothetical protein